MSSRFARRGTTGFRWPKTCRTVRPPPEPPPPLTCSVPFAESFSVTYSSSLDGVDLSWTTISIGDPLDWKIYKNGAVWQSGSTEFGASFHFNNFHTPPPVDVFKATLDCHGTLVWESAEIHPP